ncbi:MAG: hypothetical protein H6Q68_2231 [Firmicutes bacterium]|nr:hypothetical protein [Bacillota bacterium]
MDLITVRDVLRTEEFSCHRLIAGEAGLGREVKTVIVGETPEIKKWLTGGDFVITTAYFMRDKPEIMETWSRDLINSGAAALLVKTQPIMSVPAFLVNLGNEWAFPIIEGSPDMGQSQVTEVIWRLILDRQAEVIRNCKTAFNYLMKKALTSQGIDSIAEALSDVIKNPVLIESPNFRLIGNSKISTEIQDLVALRRAQHFLKNLKNNPDLKKAFEPGGKSYARLAVMAAKNSCYQVTIPIWDSNKLYGFVSVLETEKIVDEWDFAILEQACLVVAMELCRQNAFFAAEEKARSAFMTYFLDDRNFSKEYLEKIATLFGFIHNKPCLSMVLRVSADDNIPVSLSSIGENVTGMFINELTQRDPNVFVLSRYKDIVILYHPQTINSKASVEKEIQQVSKYLMESIRQFVDFKQVMLGIGRMGSNILEIRRSYEEAVAGLQIAIKFGSSDEIIHYSNLGYYRILESFMANPESAGLFIEDVIGKIIKYEQTNHSGLIATLKMYLKYNSKQVDVAKHMFLHVNTVQYRLKKIENILGNDLNVPEVRLNLWLALKLYHLLSLDNTYCGGNTI